MLDKTTLGISEELRQYIEALVEEVVLEGKSFENHKQYLRRFCEAEGIDSKYLETILSDFFETIEELKTRESKRIERLASILGKECNLSDEIMEQILSFINKQRCDREVNRRIGNETKTSKQREMAEQRAVTSRTPRSRFAWKEFCPKCGIPYPDPDNSYYCYNCNTPRC